ncbi:MAG: hypothetical protein ACLFMO_04100 [Eubacteriales bacterium]
MILVVLVLESFLMSKYIEKKRFNKKITLTTVISNIISGIIGVFLSLAYNGGWWLVCWFPWVSRNEVRFEDTSNFIIYFIVALILSIVIELVVNMIVLCKKYRVTQIAKGTLLANIISNGIVITVMYIISFSL